MAEATIDAEPRLEPLQLHTLPSAPAGTRAGATSQAPAQQDAGSLRFEFTGTGSEYFRIWVVNLLFTLLSFGIYSAWAKVRRLQYFHRNTRLAGSVFDYHGNPKAILKGRVLAVLLVGAYKISFDISKPVAGVIVLVLVAIMPWLLARAFRFKLANSSYRGVRFHFRGTVGQAYRMLILFPATLAVIGVFVWSVATSFGRDPGFGTLALIVLLPVLALGATVPLAHAFLKRFQHEHADFGQTPFFYHARTTDFFKLYGKAVGLFFLGSIPAGVFGFLTARVYQALLHTMFGWLFALLYGLASAYAFYLFVRPFLESRIQNLVWNNTELGEHRFESTVQARKLLWIHASNLMLTTLTLGLYKPFGAIRLLKYRVECMRLVAVGSLDDFAADQSPDAVGALGQEAGDLFDIDIAL